MRRQVKPRISGIRRRPMKISVLAILLSLSAVILAQRRDPADLILVNGRIYTLDAERPWAEAGAIRGDRIVAVGTTADLKAAAGQQTRTIDLKGAFASPGLNDAHVHIDSTGSLLVGVNLLQVH